MYMTCSLHSPHSSQIVVIRAEACRFQSPDLLSELRQFRPLLCHNSFQIIGLRLGLGLRQRPAQNSLVIGGVRRRSQSAADHHFPLRLVSCPGRAPYSELLARVHKSLVLLRSAIAGVPLAVESSTTAPLHGHEDGPCIRGGRRPPRTSPGPAHGRRARPARAALAVAYPTLAGLSTAGPTRPGRPACRRSSSRRSGRRAGARRPARTRPRRNPSVKARGSASRKDLRCPR